MFLIRAILTAKKRNKKTGKNIYVLYADKTWQVCDECEMDTNHPEGEPVVYVAQAE